MSFHSKKIYALVLFVGMTSSHVLTNANTPEEKVIKAIDTMTTSVTTMLPSGDLSCNCQFGAEANTLSFEDPKECGADRNYLQPDLDAFKALDPQGLFTAGRDYSQAEGTLPRKCALFIMRKFWRDRARTPEEKREADIAYNRTADPRKQRPIKDVKDYKPDSHLFAKCAPNSDATPERYPHKPCVTEDYVNLVYNSLVDVADCLDVPAKFIAPKLSNESGLHVNAFGLVNDGGIGQFTNQALADVAQNFDNFKSRITKSEKESCKRIRAIPGAVPKNGAEILSADENRCNMISVPLNPLRSLVYYGVFYHATKRNARNAFNRDTDPKNPDFRGAAQLMQDAGIGDYDQEKIKEILFVLGYNMGPGRPPVFFREWLKYRIAQKDKFPITKEDFNMNFTPTGKMGSVRSGDERALLVARPGHLLSFAEYLYAYKDSVYVANVKAQANALDKGLGEGTCTTEKFLEL